MAEPTHLHAVRGRGMIRYALVCDKRHDFESWFQNSAAYDKQAKRGLVDLPGSAARPRSRRRIMAPRSAAARRKGAHAPAPEASARAERPRRPRARRRSR